MRTSTAAAFLLLCVVGSTFALTYEESKRMSMRRHQSLEAAAPAAEGNMLETIMSVLQNSKLIELIKLIVAATNSSSGLLGDSLDSNQTILQNIVNGFYEENNLADPSTLVSCVDPADAALIVSFLPTFLSKASSLLTISGAITAATNLASQLNPDVLTCLESSSEALELGTVYDVSAIQPAAAISYLTSHVSSFVGEFSTLNKLWNQKNFNGLGNNAAAFAHTVINSMSGIHSNLSLTNWEIMQQYYNGFYAQQNLANPTYIAKCYNDNAVADFVAFEPTFLKKASSVSTIADAFANLESFNNEQAAKYPEINVCLEGNEEIAALQVALGIKHPETVNDTVKAYINANLFSTTSDFGTASKSWNSASYSNSGKQVSAWTKKSLAKN